MKIWYYLLFITLASACKSKTEEEIIVAKPINISENEITNYVEYCNNRFDMCINYPSNFKPEPEPTNGDGRVFSDEPERADIRLYGTQYTAENQMNEILNDLKNEIEIYNLKKYKNRVEIFGIDKEKQLFLYQILLIKKIDSYDDDVLCSLSFTYPYEKHKKFKSYWRVISSSFK